MFLGSVTGVLDWAVLYLALPAIDTIAHQEPALYSPMATFTTVGYGDVVLSGEWRMGSLIQAANGMIIFGWTTAAIFSFIRKIHSHG